MSAQYELRPRSVVSVLFSVVGLLLLTASALAADRLVPKQLRSPSFRPALIPNHGQYADPSVHYYAQGSGWSLEVREDGVDWLLARKGDSLDEPVAPVRWRRVKMRLVDANPDRLQPGDRLPGVLHSYSLDQVESQFDHIPRFGKVQFRNAWRGVSAELQLKTTGQPKWTYYVSGRGDLRSVAVEWQFEGLQVSHKAEALEFFSEGELLFREEQLLVLQGSQRRKACFLTEPLRNACRVSYGVESLRLGEALRIDPLLNFTTYLGAPGAFDIAKDVVADSSGNAYVTGTTSAPGSFPVESGGSCTERWFVTKIAPDGSIAWTSCIGGSGIESGEAITIDSSGSLFAAGFLGGDAAFAELDSSGLVVQCHTFGGSGNDSPNAIAVDSGNIYLAGWTDSEDLTSTGAPDPDPPGCSSSCTDGFVAWFNSSGVLQFSTYLGGTDIDVVNSIAVDGTGSIFVTGRTRSTDFEAGQVYAGGLHDAFLTGYSSSGTELFSILHGTSGNDIGSCIAIDSMGNVILGGQRPSHQGFLSWFEPDGDEIMTMEHGGSAFDEIIDLVLDDSDNIFVTGVTWSPDFPVVGCASGDPDADTDGSNDAFMSQFDSSGQLLYSTYLGGDGCFAAPDTGYGIDVDDDGIVYLCGRTKSPNFPAVGGANSLTDPDSGTCDGSESSQDGFFARFGPASTLTIRATESGALPSSYDHIYVTLYEIAVRDSSCGWSTVLLTDLDQDVDSDLDLEVLVNGDGTITLDILELTGITPATLAEGTIPSGQFPLVRLGISDVVVDDGGVLTSVGFESSEEVVAQFEVTQSQSITIDLEFDGLLSVLDSGGPPQTFRPVVTVQFPESAVFASLHISESDVLDAACAPDGSVVAALDAAHETVTFMDPATGLVDATVDVGAGPQDLEFSSDSSVVLVANSGSPSLPGDTVSVIDTSTYTCSSVQVGTEPTSIELDPSGNCAYVLARGSSAGGEVNVIDLDPASGTYLQCIDDFSVDVSPHSVAFEEANSLVAVSSPEGGTVGIFNSADPTNHSHLGTVAIDRPAELEFLPNSTDLVVANAGIGAGVSMIDAATQQLIAVKNICAARSQVETDSTGSVIYALSNARHSLALLDPSDGSLVGGETFNPFAHAANPDTSKSVMIYVALVPDDSCGSPPCPPIPRLFLAVEGGYLVAWDPLVNQIAQSMFMGGEINSLDVDSSGALIAVTVGTHVILIETDFLTGVRLRLDDSYEQALNPCTPIFSPADRFRIGNILTLPDDGAGDPDTSLAVDAMHSAVGERVFCSATGTILERFYDTSPDIYDFVMVFFSSDWRGMLDPVEGNPINIEPEAGNAFHHLVRNYTRGIGREFELGYRFGNSAANLNLNTKRLQSVVHLNDLAEFDSYAGFRGRSAISVFAQELGHRFAAFADFESTPVLKDDAAHWNSVFNSEGSVMGGTGGNWIVDNLDGTFIIAGKECTLSEWDEYLMGFRSPAEIGAGGSSFYVDDAVPLSPAWTIPPYRTDDVILGTRVDVSLSDLINQHGARIPDSRFAQKVFHVGVCVVTPGGNASQLDLDEVQDLIAALGQFWEDETEGRSNLTFQNHPTIYSTPETSLGVGSLPGRSAVADFNPSSCAVSIFAKLYVPNQGDDTVSVIDIDPNSTTFHDEIATLDVGHQPTAVAVSRDLCRAYVTSRIDGEVTVIDTAIDAVVGSEKITGVGVGSSSIAVDDNLQRAYVLNSLDETIATLDLGTRMFDSSFATGAQLLPDSELLAVSTNQKVAVLNPTTGNLIRRIPLEARSSPPGRGRRATHLTEPAHSALAVRPSTNGVYLWDDSRRLRQIDPESGSTLTLGQDVRDLEAMSFAFAEEALIGFSSATPSTAARMVQVDAGTGVVTDLGAVAANLRVQAADANPNDPSHPLYVVGRFGAGVVNQLLRFDSANPTSFAILANLTISGIDFTDPVESIVFDSRGRLIGASSANQILFDIDPSSGTLSAVRSTIGRPLHGIGVLNGQTALGDLALTADGEVLVYSNPAAGTVTRRHLATGSETTLAAGLEPSSLALIQLESNAHNTVDRALASTAPPALIYVSSRQSGEVAVFDLARNPAHPHYEFRQLPQDPDQAGPPWLGPISVSGSPSAVEFSPAGSVALVTSIQGNLCLIETAGGTVLQQVSIGHKGVSGVHFSADGQRVYLVDSGAGVLHVLR